MKFVNSLASGIISSFLLIVCCIYPLHLAELLPPITVFKWFLLVFTLYFFIREYRKESPQQTISVKGVVLGLFLFIPLVIANLCYDIVQISHHGWYHNAYVLQVLQDVHPLKNVNAPGTPPTTYWSFHYLLATFSEAFNFPSFRVNAVLNCFALGVVFIITGKILREIKVKSSGSWYFVLILIVLFNGNLFGCFSYGFNALFFDVDVINFDEPSNSERLLLPFRPVISYFIPQVTTIYSKFFNYSGVPLGLVGFLVSLYNMILFRKKMNNHWILLISCVGTFFIHTIIGLFTLATLSLALCIEFLIAGRMTELWDFIKKNILFVAAAVFYAVLAGYYILSVSQSFGTSNISFLSRPVYNLLNLILFNAPLLGVIFLATKFGKNIDIKQPDTRILIIALAIGWLMSLCINTHIGNQYNFMYCSSIIAGFLFAVWVKNQKWIAVVVVLIICNIQIVNYGYHFSKEWSKFTPVVSFDGVYSVRSEMTTWIRENTSKNTTVLAPIEILNSDDMWHYARLPYLRKDWFLIDKALLEDRTNDIENFYNTQMTSQQLEQSAEKILEKSKSDALTIIVPQRIQLPLSDRFQKAKSFDEFDVYSFE